MKDTFPNKLYPESKKRRSQHPGFGSATALSQFSSAFSPSMAADLGDPLEEPAAAICPSGSVSGGFNFGTPFPFCLYQGPARAHKAPAYMEPCSVRPRLMDKERPPRAQRGKWRPHSRLCNSEADCNPKQLPQMPVPGWASSVAAFLFCCVLFPPFRRRSPRKMTFSALRCSL